VVLPKFIMINEMKVNPQRAAYSLNLKRNSSSLRMIEQFSHQWNKTIDCIRSESH
jgi:hypothetical protein